MEELQDKIYQKLKLSGWECLKTFILSSDMKEILQKLKTQSEDGLKFTPRLSQVFRAFELCPYDSLKVVLISQDPYYNIANGTTVADGLAFSCGNTMKAQPSLSLITRDIRETVYAKREYVHPVDLSVWAKQGVLLLNSALTTTVGKPGTHYLVWRSFIVYLLDYLAFNTNSLVYVYMGKKAQDFESLTPSNNYKFKTIHPAAALHNGLPKWISGGVWEKINNALKKEGKKEIIW